MKTGPVVLRAICMLALGTAAIAAIPRACAATNLFKFYLGGSVGHSDLRADDGALFSKLTGLGAGTFYRSDSAWQLTAGIRALEVLGAEVDYFDLGSGEGSTSASGADTVTAARISQRGEAAFALLYLPIPYIDVYFKAGLAHLDTNLSATITGALCQLGHVCPPFCIAGVPCGVFVADEVIAAARTAFADGAGVQLKLGNWAIRGEYERFTALGEHASLASVGVTWSFL